MQNASHLLQNEALHSKYHKHISKKKIIVAIGGTAENVVKGRGFFFALRIQM